MLLWPYLKSPSQRLIQATHHHIRKGHLRGRATVAAEVGSHIISGLRSTKWLIMLTTSLFKLFLSSLMATDLKVGHV